MLVRIQDNQQRPGIGVIVFAKTATITDRT